MDGGLLLGRAEVLGDSDVLSPNPGRQCDEAVIAAVSTSSSNRMKNLLEAVR